MNRHLTEKELIEYQFKLATESRAAEIARHLEDCADCRQKAEQLKRKFAMLDLLREETTISDKLILETVQKAKESPKSRMFLFRKPVWIGVAAAVLLLGLMLLVPDFKNGKKQDHQIAKDIRTSAENKFNEALKAAPERPMAKEPSVSKPAEAFRAGKEPAAKTEIATEALDKVGGPEASEKPPFAPASAIELVVLPRRDNVQLTIYNSADMTLVREKRNLTLKRSWNWLQFMWADTLIDPTSLCIEPVEQKDKIAVQQLVFPARLKDLGRWLIHSDIEGQVPFEITYFTSGLSWRAFYMGTLSVDEQKMRLQGYVRVTNNSGEDYENAQTRLLVGKVHILDEIAALSKQQYPYGRPIGKGMEKKDVRFYFDEADKVTVSGEAFNESRLGMYNFGVRKPKEIKKEGLSEYFLYTIEGTETIPDKWDKRLQSFDAGDVNVDCLCKYDEEKWGDETIRFVSFANDKKHNLGQTPIPNGDVKIYTQADGDGHLSYIGGTAVKYIPVDEKVELNLGAETLVSIKPTLMDYKTENYVFDSNENITGWDEVRKWKMEINNTRTLPINAEITRGFDTNYWKLDVEQKELSYEKYDVRHARFKLTVRPASKLEFEYTVRTYHGRREEAKQE